MSISVWMLLWPKLTITSFQILLPLDFHLYRLEFSYSLMTSSHFPLRNSVLPIVFSKFYLWKNAPSGSAIFCSNVSSYSLLPTELLFLHVSMFTLCPHLSPVPLACDEEPCSLVNCTSFASQGTGVFGTGVFQRSINFGLWSVRLIF